MSDSPFITFPLLRLHPAQHCLNILFVRLAIKRTVDLTCMSGDHFVERVSNELGRVYSYLLN